MPRQLKGAAAIARQGLNFSPRARFARLALVDGSVGLILAPRGRLSLALRLTVANGKITGMDVVADLDRLGRVTLAFWIPGDGRYVLPATFCRRTSPCATSLPASSVISTRQSCWVRPWLTGTASTLTRPVVTGRRK